MVRRRTTTTSNTRGQSRSISRARTKGKGKVKEAKEESPLSGALSIAPIPARVYKRWIFVSVILTLTFSWFFFPYWLDTKGVPEKLGRLSEYFFETAIFKMLPTGSSLFGDDFLGNVTDILKPFWKTEDEQPMPGKILRKKGARAKHPVVMIPGITSTGLELWEGEACAASYFRQRLWGTLTMMRFMVLDSACWLQHLKLNSTNGLDPDGIKLRAAQGLEAADFILPGFWVWAPIIENLAELGYDHNSLIMAPYDWRLDVMRLEERDHYFSRLKVHIELLVKTRGEKVVIVSHSLGGNIWLYFMKWVEAKVTLRGGGDSDDATRTTSTIGAGSANWVDKHIHASFSIGAPYLGVPKSLSMIISGEMRDTAQLGQLESFLLEMLMSKRERLSLFRTWGGGFAMLPKGGNLFWGNGDTGSIVDTYHELDYGLINMDDETAAETGMKKKYYVDDIDELLSSFLPEGIHDRAKLAYSNGIATPSQVAKNDHVPSTWMNPLESRLPHAPSMTMYCIYGVGRDTERGYEYELFPRDQWPEHLQNLTDDALKYHQRTDNLTDLVVMIKLRLEAAQKEQRLYTGIYHVDGDGTVPTLSNGYMSAYGWKNLTHLNPSKMKIVTREYKDEPSGGIGKIRGGPRTSEHVDILGNYEVTMDLLKIATGWEEDGAVEDRILSDIVAMAEKIKLPL